MRMRIHLYRLALWVPHITFRCPFTCQPHHLSGLRTGTWSTLFFDHKPVARLSVSSNSYVRNDELHQGRQWPMRLDRGWLGTRGRSRPKAAREGNEIKDFASRVLPWKILVTKPLTWLTMRSKLLQRTLSMVFYEALWLFLHTPSFRIV